MFSFLFLFSSPSVSLHSWIPVTAPKTWGNSHMDSTIILLALWCRKRQVYSSPAVKKKKVYLLNPLKQSEMFKWTFYCKFDILVSKKHTQTYACMHIHRDMHIAFFNQSQNSTLTQFFLFSWILFTASWKNVPSGSISSEVDTISTMQKRERELLNPEVILR